MAHTSDCQFSATAAAIAALLFLISGAAVGGQMQQAPAASPKVGQPAPALSIDRLLEAPPGSTANWPSLEGKYVVLEFWATWCGPCVVEIPRLNEMAAELRDEPIVFLSITAEPAAEVEAFLAMRPIRGWVGLDPDKSMQKAYGVTGIPHTFIVGPDGTLLANTRSPHLTLEKLRALLAGEEVEFPSAESEAMPVRPATRAIVMAELRPSEYDEHVRSRLGTGLMSGMGSAAESIVKDAFAGQRVVIEAELPGGTWDYEIRVPRDAPDAAARLEALANDTLAAAWGIRGRRETREVDVYVLKAGEQTYALMKKATSGGWAGARKLPDGRVQVESMNAIPEFLAGTLEYYADRPVIDETGITWHGGLTGADPDEWGHGYDVAFTFEPGELESLRDSLKRNLDMKLVAAKRKVEFVVIEPIAPATTRPATRPS